jgi:hypothetical protein
VEVGFQEVQDVRRAEEAVEDGVHGGSFEAESIPWLRGSRGVAVKLGSGVVSGDHQPM